MRVAVVLDVEVADALEELADVVVELVRVIPVPFQDADVVLDDRVVRELTERERRTSCKGGRRREGGVGGVYTLLAVSVSTSMEPISNHLRLLPSWYVNHVRILRCEKGNRKGQS